MKVIDSLSPQISTEEVYHFVGRGDRPSRRLRNRIEEAIAKSQRLIKPKIAYVEKTTEDRKKGLLILEGKISLKSFRLLSALKNCDRAIIFLATIGTKLEEEINSLCQLDRISNAYIYDAIGSVGVEDLVERFQMTYELEKRGKGSTMRFSPGYCDWDIREQRKLFQIIDGRRVGISLGSGYLMSPRKSISGIFGTGDVEFVNKENSNPCRTCGKRNCPTRRG